MQVEVELSQRRACRLMELHRGTCCYRSRRPEEGGLPVRLRELAEARRRFGYRRFAGPAAAGRVAGKPQTRVLAVRRGEGVIGAIASQRCATAPGGAHGGEPGVVG